jgi:hypothetical protein
VKISYTYTMNYLRQEKCLRDHGAISVSLPAAALALERQNGRTSQNAHPRAAGGLRGPGGRMAAGRLRSRGVETTPITNRS